MKVKLALYAHDWYPLPGGVSTVTMTLATGLANWSLGHPGEVVEVTLITQAQANGMDDTCLPFRVVRRPSRSDLRALVRSADIVHVANAALMPLALSWLFRKPCVLEHDGYQAVCPNGLLLYGPDGSICPGHFLAGRYGACVRCNSRRLGWAKSAVDLAATFPRRWLARRVSINVAPTRHVGERVALPRTQLIHHGVPIHPSLVSASPASDSGRPPCFAYLGRLVTEKGVPVLLRASRQLQQGGYSFSLRIIGDGPERSVLEKMAEDLGLKAQVEFVGSVPFDSVPDMLKEVIAVVMPSVWEDVAPLAASEQLMQGNLIIASDVGGLGELVDDAGLKFPVGDAKALESCMRKVLDNPHLVHDLRERARSRGLKVFAEKRMIEEHVRLYQTLVRPRPGNP